MERAMKYATVVDSGLNVELACRLARDGIDVSYYGAWESAFVSVRDPSPGFGLEDEGVRRVDAPFTHKDFVFIFPWLNQEHLAMMLKGMGHKVFGATDTHATYLERDRMKLHTALQDATAPLKGLDVIQGCSALNDYFEELGGVESYIKVSNFRGDVETHHHTDVVNSKIKLAEWRKRFGPYAEQILFFAQEPIEAEVEVGVDTFFCGGQFLAPGLIGYEVKDKLYVGKVSEHLPPMIYDATMALAPYLKSVEYANWFTNEMRITKEGVAYVTDVTTRCPIPPGAAMLEAIDNLPEIIENGATGKPTEIDWRCKYVCEIVIGSPVLKEDWLEVRFDPEVRRWVKMRNFSKVDGRYWIAPHPTGMTEMISCVGIGDTFEDATGNADAVADHVCKKTYQASYDARAFDEVDEVIEKGVKLGIDF
jgi:hypothetical protein